MMRISARAAGGLALVVALVAAFGVVAKWETRRDSDPAAGPSQPTVLPTSRAARHASESAARATRFRGKVVSSVDRNGIAGANVRFVPARRDGLRLEEVPVLDQDSTVLETRSGKDGSFEAVLEGAGPIGVVITSPGFAITTRWLQGDDMVSIELRPVDAVRLLVTDETGRLVAGAEIMLGSREPGRPVVRVGRSDEAGVCVLRVEPNDEVILSGAGRATARLVISGADEERCVLLREGRTIAGTAVDGAGVPVADATVSLDHPSVERSARSVRTSASGEFSFDGLDAAGDALVGWRVIATLAARSARLEDVVAGDANLRLVLRVNARVGGVVVYPDGTPAVGAEVEGTSAGAEGRFECSAVAPGIQRINAFAPDPKLPGLQYDGFIVLDVAEGEAIDNARITLHEAGPHSCVDVKVLDAGGRPIAGAAVRAWLLGVPVSVDADSDGIARVIVHAVPGTPCVVSATTGDGGFASLSRDAAGATLATRHLSSKAVPLELVVRELPRLRLKFVDEDGAEVPADRVVVEGKVPCHGGECSPKADDSFRGVVCAEGFAPSEVTVFPPYLPDQTVRVVLPRSCRVAGCVRTTQGLAPAAGHRVCISSEDDTGDTCSAVADDGAFECASVRPGPATIRVYSPQNRCVFLKPIEVERGHVTDLGPLTLGSPRVVYGEVRDSDGKCVGGVLVSLFEYGGQFSALGSTTTASDGTCCMQTLTSVRLEAVFQREGYATQVVTIGEETVPPLSVSLSASHDVRVFLPSVLAYSGNCAVSVRSQGTTTWWEPRRVKTERLSDGLGNVITLADMPAGRLTLRLLSPGPDVLRSVDVAGTGSADVDFRPR